MEKEEYLVKCFIMHEERLLLLKRAKDKVESNIGKWELPGGFISKQEKFEHSIQTKIFEETELTAEIVREIALIKIKTAKEESLCYVYLLKTDKDEVKLTQDHHEYKWIHPEDMKENTLVKFASLLLEFSNNSDSYLKIDQQK